MPNGGYFDIPFAENGDLNTIPDPTQPGGTVSYNQGFPVLYSTPVGSGGYNVPRTAINQVLNDITTFLQQIQTNSFPKWYSALASGAGYPKFTCVLYTDGNVYQSQVNSNASTPGADANWMLFPLGNFTGFSTGDVKLTLKTTADAGWILCDDGTIGNAASGATTLASATAQALYVLLWTNVSNTYAPVSGGRGANALADFNANKTLGLTAMLGRALALSGTGAGLTARTLGETFGEENHVLVTGELASHTHTASVTDGGHFHDVWSDNGTASVSPLGTSGATIVMGGIGNGTPTYYADTATGSHQIIQDSTTGISVSNAATGSGTGHNTMQPTAFLNAMIKL